MQSFSFEWDPAKAALNLRKHGISFEEAESAFDDEHSLMLEEALHLEGEHRFLLLGMSSQARILVVVHCYRSEGARIRIISARTATRSERDQYVARWKR